MQRHNLILATLLVVFIGFFLLLSACRSKSNQDSQNNDLPAGHPQGKKAPVENAEISVDPAKEGITLAELFSNRNAYENKIITVSGQVVKVNTGIMGKNWIHIQDGTKDGDDFDLTITTQNVVEVGAVVTFEGKIELNKDFGSGYTYEVIMEDAVVVADS